MLYLDKEQNKEQKHLHIILDKKVLIFNKKTKKFYNLRNNIQDKLNI